MDLQVYCGISSLNKYSIKINNTNYYTCHDDYQIIKNTFLLFKGALAYRRSHYGPGTGPVYLSNVQCTGAENILTNCSRTTFGDAGSSCKAHNNDASVSCPTGK